MPRGVAWLDRRFYPYSAANWDDLYFRQIVLAELDESSRVLDIGAGAGIVEEMDFRSQTSSVHGIDPDPRVLTNPFLDSAVVGVAESLPYPVDHFDVVVADNVLEHLDSPSDVFAEVARVLRPSGVFLFKTPNRNHYMPRLARATPHAFHAWINRRRGRKEVDTFPTHYLANTPGQITSLAASSGLVPERIELIEGRPEYLRFNVMTYLPGIAYERLVNSSDRFSRYRIVLIASLRRRA